MPLIPQQDIVVVQLAGGTPAMAVAKLHEQLETYPLVRIISIAMKSMTAMPGVDLVAVVETI